MNNPSTKRLFWALSFLMFLCNCQKKTSFTESFTDQEMVDLNPVDPWISVSTILNGAEVTTQDPFSTSIVGLINQEKGSLCTGTLLTRQLVLTAAHCMPHQVTSLKVFTGLSRKDRSSVLDAVSFEVTPDWKTRSTEATDRGDLAIVKISGDLPKYFKPVELAQSKDLQNGLEVTVVGYGRTDGIKKVGAGTLRKDQILISKVDYSATEVLFDQRNGRGACHGDSGGPAFISLAGRHFQWGVTSREFQDPDKTCNQYSIYTKIEPYFEWIQSQVSLNFN